MAKLIPRYILFMSVQPLFLLLAILGLPTLAGCTAYQPPDPGFDGVYAGESTRTRGGGRLCGPEIEPLTVSVFGGVFGYGVPVTTPYALAGTLTPVSVRIVAGGRVDGATLYEANDPLSPQGWRSAWATVVGHVAGTRLEADIESLTCGRRLTLLKG